MKKFKMSNKLNNGALYILPTFIIFFILIVLPILYTIGLSFFRFGPFNPDKRWIGLDNYKEILIDNDFWNALSNGLFYAFGTTILQLVIGLGIALMLNKAMKGIGIARSLLLMPYLIPTVAVALTWDWILNGMYGVVNALLLKFGLIDQPIHFLQDSKWVFFVVIFISVWQFVPFVILVLLARLNSIPSYIYEASKMDGSSSIRQFFDMTLPLLKSAILLVVLLRGVWMFNRFDLVWLLTKGGPAGTTTTLPIYAYVETFQNNQFGYGSAVSTVMFMILLVFGIIYVSVFKPEKEVTSSDS